MPFELQGAGDLMNDLTAMAAALDTNGDGATANRALKSGAVLIESRMVQNASSDPKIITGDLVGSIRTSGVKKRSGGGKYVTIGVHHSNKGAFYANPVEFGHGGPAPAPAHPFVRPAFDVEKDAAYEAMKDTLRAALEQRS